MMKIICLAMLLFDCVNGRQHRDLRSKASDMKEMTERLDKLEITVNKLEECNEFCLSSPPSVTCADRKARVNELGAKLAANTNNTCTIEPPDTSNTYDGFGRYRLVCTESYQRSQVFPTMYNANVVLVGGGGAGGAGNINAAGGGAGALIRRDVDELVEAEYFITIGKGGVIENADPDNGSGDGKDSVLETVATVNGQPGINLRATGGGRGGGTTDSHGHDGNKGGSGGGAAGCLNLCNSAPLYQGGGSTIGGNLGGNSPPGMLAGGGGGAGANGQDGISTATGGGGEGLDLSSVVGTKISRGPLGSPSGWFAGGGDADFHHPDGKTPGVTPNQGGGGFGCNSPTGLCSYRNYPGLDFSAGHVGNSQGFQSTGGGGGGAAAGVGPVGNRRIMNSGGSGILIIAFDACPSS